MNSIIISGGGSRVVWAQGLLSNSNVRKRFEQAEVYAGVSAGAILALLCARYVDTPSGLKGVSQRDFKLIPHWGGVAGIFVSSMFHSYVFSHRQLCHSLYAELCLPDGEDAVITRAVSVGVSDITRNCYEEKHFPAGTSIRESRIVDWVAASCSIYGIFEGWRRGNELYQDGGYSHNIPRDAIKNASPDSMIISLVPLNKRVGEYGGNGFWKFLMGSNLAFYNTLYSDINHQQRIFTSTNLTVFTSRHGEVWTPRKYKNFTLTYKYALLRELRTSGSRAACEHQRTPYIVTSTDHTGPRMGPHMGPHTGHTVTLAVLVVVVVIIIYASK